MVGVVEVVSCHRECRVKLDTGDTVFVKNLVIVGDEVCAKTRNSDDLGYVRCPNKESE